MTKQEFLSYCHETYGTLPDHPFEGDGETAVLRHSDTKKWYALVMRLPRRRLGLEGDERSDVVNLKMPLEMLGSFDESDGVYPAYHMNKLHWISLLLSEATDETVQLLTMASFEATAAASRAAGRRGAKRQGGGAIRGDK